MANDWLNGFAALCVTTLMSAPANAQTTPGSGASLSGSWTLDAYLSDKPQQVAAAIAVDLGVTGAPLFPAAEEGRGARGGAATGPDGGGGGRRGNAPPRERSERPTLSADEQRTLDMITTPVRYPPPSLQVSETQTAVTFTDAEGRTRSFQTNGKREPQSFDSARVESSARREGPQLVIDFDLGKGRKMTYTYFVVPTSQQLLLRITFERAPKEPGPFEVKYVYARAATVP